MASFNVTTNSYTVGAGGRDQEANKVSLSDFARYRITYLQNYFIMVVLPLSELEIRLGLENPIYSGKYCTVSDISQSKFALFAALTSYLIIAILRCYDWVGAEISHQLANTVRRFCICGFLTTRSPNLTITKVSLWNV